MLHLAGDDGLEAGLQAIGQDQVHTPSELFLKEKGAYPICPEIDFLNVS